MENVKNGKVESLDADVIMVCVGRRPYTETLGLETCGIEVNERGQVPVDDNFKVDLWLLRIYKTLNNLNRINLPSPHPQWSLFSLSLIHSLATGSAMRAVLFYWDGLWSIFKI